MTQFHSVAKKIGFALVYPMITLWIYWRRLARQDEYALEEMLLASGVALFVAVGIFLYVPLAKKVRRGSPVWIVGIALITGLIIVGATQEGRTWAWPLLFFAIWMPVIHVCCQHIDAGSRWRFHNALQP